MWWLSVMLAVVASDGASDIVDGGRIARGLPRVEYRGGPYLRHPRIVTITFEADDPALISRLRAFGGTVTRSAWWRTVTDGYCAGPGDCIGEGRDAQHVQLQHVWPAEVRGGDVADLLDREVKAGHFDPLDADTLLLVYLPKGIELSDAFVPRYCAGGPRAFHRMLRLEHANVAFAVLPRCGGEAELPSQGTLGAISKGDITAVPGDPLGTHRQTAWLRFQPHHLTGIIDLGARSCGTLYQQMVERTARHHGDKRLQRGPGKRVAAVLGKDDA